MKFLESEIDTKCVIQEMEKKKSLLKEYSTIEAQQEAEWRVDGLAVSLCFV